jgi:hypothetical protein
MTPPSAAPALTPTLDASAALMPRPWMSLPRGRNVTYSSAGRIMPRIAPVKNTPH